MKESFEFLLNNHLVLAAFLIFLVLILVWNILTFQYEIRTIRKNQKAMIALLRNMRIDNSIFYCSKCSDYMKRVEKRAKELEMGE